MAFFPNIAEAKQEMHSLYRNYAHLFDISSENAGVGSNIVRRQPAMLDRSVFLTGSAIWTIALHYKAHIYRWLLQKFSAIQGAPIACAMILRSLCRRSSLPFFLGISVLTARIYNYVTIPNHIYAPQLCARHDANLQGDLFIQDTELCNKQSLDSSFLGSKHDFIRLALQCVCSTANLKVYTTPKQIGFNGKCVQKNTETGSFWRILPTNEQCLMYIGALVTLQLFMQLSRVNITTLLLPMLYQTTNSQGNAAAVSNIVILLVNSFGILGSSFTTKHHGREVTFTVSAILMVFCQITIPLLVEAQIGLGGGTRILTGYTTATFLLTCVVSYGLSWSWGSLFCSVPGMKIQSAGQVFGMGLSFVLCFVQMQYFLLMLCRLKNAVLAYYAVWIWS
ncbi:sugar transport protein MST1-like [Oryza brachyantha]|uniref:Major facilitator superfamily (MFS) profile domain-containing protein n=1 Tax=Oryza brachyantha TaxID=4533 RepID=J3LE31_ORYBR|nr:sugar transport protein MST1-like [Oryza brachyantha]